jgi:hypothetical protein
MKKLWSNRYLNKGDNYLIQVEKFLVKRIMSYSISYNLHWKQW